MIRRSAVPAAALAAAAAVAALAAVQPAGAASPAKRQPAAVKAQVPVEEFTLDNGMKFLLVRKPEQATVNAGWVARVGSSNERPGITGVAHFFEHMMFKGSRTVGTKDAKRDQEIIDQQEALQEKIRAEYARQRERYRKGEIDDVFDPKNRTPELIDLEALFQKLVEEQRALMVKDEFDKLYTEAGASGMNATTNVDSTVYFITVPANKLELWFWMESDRLSQPVFREFYAERDVVQEERRMRTDSTPTGKYDEQLNAMFWTSHPYKWETIGWMSDLKTLSMADAKSFFETYYAPNNLTAALVGNFEIAEVKAMARKYFGRIPRGPRPVPDVVTLEVPQLAEKRMNAECDCQPQVSVQYHAVPFEHRDSYALEVLAGVLNGQTGRLYKDLVLDKQIATSASAGAQELRWAGTFAFSAETKGNATPADLEAAWQAQVDRLQSELVPASELQKVKNQIAADSYRRLQNPFFLLIQLLFYDGWGDWRYLNDSAPKMAAVTSEDVQRVAKQYLTTENRTVADYRRKPGSAAAEVPPELADLPPEMRAGIMAQIQQIRATSDVKQLEQLLAAIEEHAAQVPPELKKAIGLVTATAQARLDELKAGAPAKDGGQ
jgi:predicted Zn-dependent peptidase